MMLGAAGVALCGAKNVSAEDGNGQSVAKRETPPRNRRPYKSVDWSKVERIKTTSHGHCTSQKMLDVYLQRGFGLMTMSNYYPSAPYVPAAKMTKNYYRLHHGHPVTVKGKPVAGPFDWNKIIEGY